MTKPIGKFLKDEKQTKVSVAFGSFFGRGVASGNFFSRGMGSVISLNSKTDFQNRVDSLRLSEGEMLAKDARRIGQDMWNVLEG